jgi:hypothetical protein
MDRVLNIITTAARNGKTGDGKFFVPPIENMAPVRTSEEGDNAIQVDRESTRPKQSSNRATGKA